MKSISDENQDKLTEQNQTEETKETAPKKAAAPKPKKKAASKPRKKAAPKPEKKTAAEPEQKTEVKPAEETAAQPKQEIPPEPVKESAPEQKAASQPQQEEAPEQVKKAPSKPWEKVHVSFTRKQWIIIAAIAAIAVCALIGVQLMNREGDYTVNEYTVSDVPEEVPEGYEVFRLSTSQMSFLIPEGTPYWNGYDEDGVFVYLGEPTEIPYIIIHFYLSLKEIDVGPKEYFRLYKEKLKKAYPNAETSKISEVHVSDRTLYMVRSTAETDEGTLTIDRYYEPYEKTSYQFTLKTYDLDTDEPKLYSLIESFRPYWKAYQDSDDTGSMNGSNSFITAYDPVSDIDQIQAQR